MKKIYLAGGWFTPEAEEEHTRIYNILVDNCFVVFNPKLESLVNKDSTNQDMAMTLLGNVDNICDADIIVAIYDRKDTGTIWETGYAYAMKKPIIYYAETLNGKPFNLMLAKTGRFAKNTEQLINMLFDDTSYMFKTIRNDYTGDVE